MLKGKWHHLSNLAIKSPKNRKGNPFLFFGSVSCNPKSSGLSRLGFRLELELLQLQTLNLKNMHRYVYVLIHTHPQLELNQEKCSLVYKVRLDAHSGPIWLYNP